ncbi:hypothetical protein SAMN05519104_6717 [Rhizobiales bacterium GAS188]|nr:hypothetical protein SAMN05519104_6717 [Rhizobiales bacterium GAS188]
MTMIHAELTSEFKGETVVLVKTNIDGLNLFRSALLQVEFGSSGEPALIDGDQIHLVTVNESAAQVELSGKRVIWRLPRRKVKELMEKVSAMIEAAGPCHHYVDIDAPAHTLVISRDEYT